MPKFKLLPNTRRDWFRALLIAGLPAITIAILAYFMIAMPGKSHSGPLPTLTESEAKSAQNLERIVNTLASEIGQRNFAIGNGLADAEAYLTNELTALNYQVNRQPYSVGPIEVANLGVEVQGSTAPEEIIIIGAHYDTVNNDVGADDNASGVAVTLELARLLKTYQPQRTIRFVFFANEEPPHFQTDTMGSLVYAQSCADKNENIIAMLSLETVGFYTDEPGTQNYPFPLNLFYPDTGNFIAFVGNLNSRSLTHQAIKEFRATTQFPSQGATPLASLPGVGWSDHWAFWQHNYPAIMITDTAPFRNPHYHQTTDTPQTLNYPYMARLTQGLTHVIRNLDQQQQN